MRAIDMVKKWNKCCARLKGREGETLTEVLVSVLIAALGVTLFLTAYLASGRMLIQGEEQMEAYYRSRNELESGVNASGLDVYALELYEGTDSTRVYTNLALKMDTAKYQCGYYPVEVYTNLGDDSADTAVKRLYRYRFRR